MADEITHSAMVALIAQWYIAYQKREKYKREQEVISQEIAGCDKIIEQCMSTCKAVGYDYSDTETWAQALDEFGSEAVELYNRSRPIGLPQWEPKWQEKPAAITTAPTKPAEDRPPIKDIVIAQLKLAGPAGAKAADIRKHIESTYHIEIHGKTVGMTLYRLLNEGKVSRDRHVWFIVNETVNPGAATPGSVTKG